MSTCSTCRSLGPRPPWTESFPPPTEDEERARDSRIRGVLIGGALGEVVGTLVAEGGEVPVDPTPASLRTGAATSLTLFTAEGALRMLVRSHAKGIGPAWTVIRHAYDRWLFAQGLPRELVGGSWAGGGGSWPDGWLITQHVLHRPVDGFQATVAALRSATVPNLSRQREIEPRPNASDGAGALVRAAPVGLLVPADVAFEAGVRTAAFTHGGPVGSLGPGIVARLVAELVQHGDLVRALGAAQDELRGWPHHGRVAGVVEAAMAGEAAAGKAGVAGRSLHAALRGVLTDAGDPLATMTDATHAGGTAAAIITGQLLGARLGHTAFAGRYRVALDVIGTIEEMADAMSLAHRRWVLGSAIPGLPRHSGTFDGDPVSSVLWERFPGW